MGKSHSVKRLGVAYVSFNLLIGLKALLSLQANTVLRQKAVHQRYKQACISGASVVVILAYYWYRWSALNGHLHLHEAVSAFVSLLAFLSFPRRPVVYSKGNKIIHEKGVSVLGWLLFSWGLHPEHGSLPATLAFSDLPRIGYNQSAQGVRKRFDAGDHTKPLWKQLTRVCLGPLVLQWILVLLEALSEFLIRFAMHHLLQSLEITSSRESRVWAWVALIAVGQLGETAADSWGGWIGHTKLQLPTLALIQSLIFEKMMRTYAQDDPTDGGKNRDHTAPNPMDLLDDDR
jgi:hypothetical protein